MQKSFIGLILDDTKEGFKFDKFFFIEMAVEAERNQKDWLLPTKNRQSLVLEPILFHIFIPNLWIGEELLWKGQKS